VLPPKPGAPDIRTVGDAGSEASFDSDFEEEYFNARTRPMGAKERAINPGPRLERHPSDEEEAEPAAEEALQKRKRTARQASPKPEISPVKTTSSSSPLKANGAKDSKDNQSPEDGSLLFSRVSVETQEDSSTPAIKKARVTAIDGDKLEVITEGNWDTMKVGMSDVKVIDETQFGKANVKPTDAKDFGFLFASGTKR